MDEWTFSVVEGARNGVSASFQGDSVSATVVFVDERTESWIQKDYLERTDRKTAYFLGEVRRDNYRVCAGSSLTTDLVLSSFLEGMVKGKCGYLKVKKGTLQAFLPRTKVYDGSLSFRYQKGLLLWEEEVLIGPKPIYSSSYRSLHSERSMTLKLEGMTLQSRVEYDFQKGKSGFSYSLSLSHGPWSLGYSSSHGASLRFSKDGVGFSLSEKEFSMNVELASEDRNPSFEISLSSEKVWDFKFSWVL